ncbi:MAG: ABC transporter ATP-binding protein [Synechococcus sp.]
MQTLSATALKPTTWRRESIAISTRMLEMTYRSSGTPVPVLRNINFSVASGEVQFLMGPSGSGKTTLLSILAGILTPTGGDVELLGETITRMSRKRLSQFRRSNIGFIFQGFNLFPTLTISENVEVALNLANVKGTRAKQQALFQLERVGLADKANARPADLSGGQQQRVAIARALVSNPKLIMADEPTASLDSRNGQVAMELLQRLAKESDCTVLVVTHDPRITPFADRIIHMEDGCIIDTEERYPAAA